MKNLLLISISFLAGLFFCMNSENILDGRLLCSLLEIVKVGLWTLVGILTVLIGISEAWYRGVKVHNPLPLLMRAYHFISLATLYFLIRSLEGLTGKDLMSFFVPTTKQTSTYYTDVEEVEFVIL